MMLCGQCPNNPNCYICLEEMKAEQSGHKVCPARSVQLTNLANGHRIEAELRAVSRVAVGLFRSEGWVSGRYEVELAAGFRIIASTAGLLRSNPYAVFDIEKVLSREEVLDRLLLDDFHSWHLSQQLAPEAILLAEEENNEQRKRVIKQELEKFVIVKQLTNITFLLWEQGKLRSLDAQMPAPPSDEEFQPLVTQVLAQQTPGREHLYCQVTNRLYDVHVLPLSADSCGIALIDITAAIAAEREKLRQEWELYRDVLAIVSNGKLALVDNAQLYELIRMSEKRVSLPIREPADLAQMRTALRSALESAVPDERQLLRLLVAVNEAATNSLSHGSEGIVELYMDPARETYRIWIGDKGKGISLKELPKATLQQGYSTKQSLGMGFQMMLQFSSKVWINSSARGTTILLEYCPPEGKNMVSGHLETGK